ncbi:hypothetical protein GCM10020331_044020 [Ectobacillus funiculus]
MKLHVHQPVFVMNRVGALLIDMFIISLVYGAAAAVISGEYKAVFLIVFQVSLGDARYDMLLALVIMAAYFVLLPLVWNGRTIGSRFFAYTAVKGERGSGWSRNAALALLYLGVIECSAAWYSGYC